MTESPVTLPHTGLRVPHTRLNVTSLKTLPTPDGEAFTATLRLDGRIIGHIHNDGRGGATTWSTNGGSFSWRDLDTFVAACRTSAGTVPLEEHVLDELVEEYATARTVAKHERANRTPLRLCQLIDGVTYGAGQAAATKVSTEAHRRRLIAELAAASPAGEDEWWQLWNGAAWEDLTARPTQPKPSECGCSPACAVCGEPQGNLHDLHCAWVNGSGTVRDAFIESPTIAAAPTVMPEHTHRTGCPHVVRRPGPLFAPVDEVHMRCTMCRSVDTMQAQSLASFGGTAEGYEKCTACGEAYGWADINAIV